MGRHPKTCTTADSCTEAKAARPSRFAWKLRSGGRRQAAHAGDLAACCANAGDRWRGSLEGDRHVMGVGMHERRFVPHNGDMAFPEQKIASPQLLELVRARERASQCMLLHVAVAWTRDAAGGERKLQQSRA